MSDKFKYAPGKPGIGTKGDDGSVGLQGLAMYFTDLDAVTDVNTINQKIENNLVLWAGSSNPLLDGRTYVTGDLFFDSDGKSYEINAETNTFTSIGGSLNMGGFFVPLGINSDNGFQRYFNSNNSPKYIIDNVYTPAGAINYTESPLNIYGIGPKDFARVEYTNVVMNGTYNPFTVYSSGVAGGIDDQKSMAIVRRDSDNTFRIGNLDDVGNIRNVNLIFDVSSLTQTKQAASYFNTSTLPGTILTNYEIPANSLFDPNFNSSPVSFFGNMGTTDVSVSWTLADFTNDPTVTGDLYFYEILNSNTFRIDSSAARPLIFSNVGASGKIRITGVSSTKAYGCYMKLNKNGWIRNSKTINVYTSHLQVLPPIYGPETSAASLSPRVFEVSTNFKWTYSILQADPTFISTTSASEAGGFDGSIYVNWTANASTKHRYATIRVSPTLGGNSVDVSIWQLKGAVGPELYLYSPANASSNFAAANWPNYTVNASVSGKIKGNSSITLEVSANAQCGTWTTSGVPGWATLTPNSGTGNVPCTLTISPEASLGGRTANIIFNYGDTPAVVLSINQDIVYAYSNAPSMFLQFNKYSGPIYPTSNFIQISFTQNASVPWSIINPVYPDNWVQGYKNPPYPTIDYSGIGNFQMNLNVDGNSGPQRTTAINLNSGAYSFDHYIIQQEAF